MGALGAAPDAVVDSSRFQSAADAFAVWYASEDQLAQSTVDAVLDEVEASTPGGFSQLDPQAALKQLRTVTRQPFPPVPAASVGDKYVAASIAALREAAAAGTIGTLDPATGLPPASVVEQARAAALRKGVFNPPAPSRKSVVARHAIRLAVMPFYPNTTPPEVTL
jgi:hypothetical protein